MRFSFCTSLCLATLLLLTSCGSFGTSKEQYVQRGNEFAEKGLYADATLNYRNALKKDPAYAEAYYRLGILRNSEAGVSDAITSLEKALALQLEHEGARLALAKLYLEGLTYLPSPPQPFYDKLLTIAQQYIKRDAKSFHGNRILGHMAMLDSKPAEASVRFQTALAAQPDSAEVATLLMQSLLSSGQGQAAEAFAQKSLAANPAKPALGTLYDLLYLHYRDTKRMVEAEALLQSRIGTNPTDVLGVVQLARHQQSLQQYKKVDETLAKLMDGKAYPDGLFAVGDFYRDSGDPQRAIAAYQKGVESGPPAADTYRKRLVEIYLRTNQTQPASVLLDALLQSDANDGEVIAARAAIRAASGQATEMDTAIAAFTKLVEANPQAVSYRYDLARTLGMRGNQEEARKHLLKVIQIEPSHMPSLVDLANLSIQRANAQEAFLYANRALAVNPKLPGTRLVYSAALALQGRSTEARQEINMLIREFPALAEAPLQLALLNMQEKRYPEAETIYRRHLKPGQTDTRALRGLVELGFASGQPEKVLPLLQEEVRRQPNAPSVRMMLGTAAARMNKSEIALEQFRWLKQNTPPSANIEAAIGFALQSKGDWPGAIAQFQAARQLVPKDPEILGALAYALQQSGHPGGAIPIYREALQANPGSAGFRNNLAMALMDSGSDLKEALQLAETAVSKEPQNPIFADALGLIYLKRKEAANAIQTFRSALSKNTQNVSCRIHLAKAFAESGDKAKAKAELAKVNIKSASPQERKEMEQLSLAMQ